MFRKLLQILHEPRQVTEKEDVNLIRSFLFSTKPSLAEYAVSRKNGHDKAKEFIGTDFVIVPEKIWDSSSWGHIKADTYEEEMAEIKKHSHGTISKIYGPFYYDDSPEDYYYEAGIKLNGSKASSALLENGSKTWTKFAVSPQIWVKGLNMQDVYDLTDYKPQGLFLVIKPGYGDESVVKKMCSGSELACGKSLASAILTLDHNASDDYLSEVLTSYINIPSDNSHKMAQQVEQLKPKEVKEVELPKLTPETKQENKEVVEEITKEYNKGITLSQEEFESYKKEREEHKQLVLENKTNKLNELFNVVEDTETRNSLVSKYIDKDVNLIVQYHKDVFPHVEKFVKGKEVKTEEPKKEGSKSSSILKKEPKIETDESKSSSIVVPNNVNEVLDFSRMITGDII